MTPHSKTVRGTFSNPFFSPTSQPPQLGDPVSLEREKNASASFNQTQNSNSPKEFAPDGWNRQKESQAPHSKTVRGTFSNTSGPKVNKSMLGDPVSLKAETSNRGFDDGAASSQNEQEEMRKAAEKRVEAGRSKL